MAEKGLIACTGCGELFKPMPGSPLGYSCTTECMKLAQQLEKTEKALRKSINKALNQDLPEESALPVPDGFPLPAVTVPEVPRRPPFDLDAEMERHVNGWRQLTPVDQQRVARELRRAGIIPLRGADEDELAFRDVERMRNILNQFLRGDNE